MNTEYKIRIEIAQWQVGYQQELDELFLFKVDEDGLVTIIRNGAVDAQFFEEFTSSDVDWIKVCDL